MKLFKNKKINIISIILSIFLSLIIIIGKNISRYMFNPNINIFSQIINFKYFIIFILLTFITFILLNLFFNISKKIKFINSNNITINSKKVFIISFIIIFICYIPYFLDNYPAIMSSDTISQFNQIFHDINLNNSHPVIHTLFMSLIFNFGKIFSNSNNISVAFISITQMIIMSLIFSYVIKFLYDKKVNKYILIIVLIYYALYPVHAIYSVTLWKDIMFSGLFTIFTIYIYKLYEKDNICKIDILKYFLITIAMIFFRNNAIYVFIICIPFLSILFKKYKIKLLALNLFILIFYYIITGPIYSILNISQTSSVESLAIPIQQVGRIVYKNEKIDGNDIKLINAVIDINILKNIYNPITVDNIKFNSSFDGKVIEENKQEYIKLYLRLIKNHPLTSIESYLCSTLGYWYPFIDYWINIKGVYNNLYDIYYDSKLNLDTSNIIDNIKNINIFKYVFSIGLCFILILISIFNTYLLRNKKYIIFYIPIIGLWITMMIATPVFAEFRYIYSAFTLLPFFILLPFLKKDN